MVVVGFEPTTIRELLPLTPMHQILSLIPSTKLGHTTIYYYILTPLKKFGII